MSYTLRYKVEALTTDGHYAPLIDGGRIIECDTYEEAALEMADTEKFYMERGNLFTRQYIGLTRVCDEQDANGSLINSIFKTARNLQRKSR